MAPELVGALLVADPGTPQEVRAVVVEVEAYLGLEDPASHAFRGPTPRAAIMFGEPGHLYVYLSYGLHHCANVVCEPAGTPGAVLLRGAAVVVGEEVVRARRRAAPRRGAAAGWRTGRPAVPAAPECTVRPPAAATLLRGPGNLCRGLGLSLADAGADLAAGGGRLSVLEAPQAPPLAIGPRVGISAGTDAPLRFWWSGHPAVTHRGGTVRRAG